MANSKVECKKVNITEVTKFAGKREDFSSNEANKQALIQLIMERMRQKGCDVSQAEGDADVEIARQPSICLLSNRPLSSCFLALPCRCF